MRDETANSSALLREAILAIREKFPEQTTGEVVARALIKHVGIRKESAEEIALRVDRLAAEPPIEKIRQNRAKLQAAMAEIYHSIHLDSSYDVPALAGYAKDSARSIYFDKGLKREWKLSSGETIDIAPYLALHEVVEKALMLELKFESRGYQRTHQIAQRLEQEAVRADGISWKEYQYTIMIPEIDRAYTHRAFMLPPDLDSTPYRDLNDLEILGPVPHKFFTASKIAENIYHILFETGIRMATTMMRFQEFYESPKFRGKYFTREEFISWYSSEKNGATYTQNWAEEGFNIPSSVFKPFYKGHFSPLTEDESEILEYFRNKTGLYYIIATAPESGKEKLDHEIAHALYYLNPQYKNEVDQVLRTLDTASIRAFLTTNPEYASYHEAVLDDEVHAYLAHSSDELEAHDIDLAPYAEAIKQLQALYKKYLPPERG